jgi:arylsulfatase A-like enzyme
LKAPVVYDFAPTLIRLAGLPVPADLDGRVIEELCDDEFRSSHPLLQDRAEGAVKTDDAGLSDSEAQMVEEKLRSLGYL